MSVYIDLVILLNFLFDCILLISVSYGLRRECSSLRIFFSSLFGEVTIFALFIDMNIYLFFVFKVLVSVLMILICFGYKDIRYFGKNITYFYLVSMLLGGSIEFLMNQFSYNGDASISYLVIIILSLFLFVKYIKSFVLLKNNYSYYYKCRIFFDNNKSKVFNAFLDTGNKLKVPYLDKSIVLVDKDKVVDIGMKNPIYVPFSSLNNRGLLECYKCLKLEMDGKYFDKFLIGVSDEKFFIDGIDCIINNCVMEGLR